MHGATTMKNKNSAFCPHYIYVFCTDLETNCDYFPYAAITL
jgi:hypothetical protein